MDRGLAGRSCIVTGASRGIGAAVAAMLAEEDARVTLVGRSADALASQAEAIGSQASTIAIDVCDPDAIAQIAAAGPFDALVNNAGASVAQPLIDVSEADWQRQWDLNVVV